MRIREAGENVPKPMVTIGYRPILWHVMKYYAHYGHKEFILCLGYRGDVIKNYFLNYSECLSNDFVLSDGGKKLELMKSDIHDFLGAIPSVDRIADVAGLATQMVQWMTDAYYDAA